ncbi:hypothetical protein [Metabacillus niabensis]|uniref:hypothetical protein n=1 Tax=Metabacillus niabensis TaxID=324854 RepID=UPI001CFBD978|nr:hypothetical protein [Metabacillus niabensis]
MKVRKRKQYILIITLIIALSACSLNPDLELYEGEALRIAVVGEPPDIKEEQVRFSEISFDELLSKELDSFDAVFIMKDHLYKAAESQYTDVYLNTNIPFFFISAKSHIPFTVKDTEYDESWNWTPGNSYTVGVLRSEEGDSLRNWEFGLYNDEKTEEHIKEMYSRTFKEIEGLEL